MTLVTLLTDPRTPLVLAAVAAFLRVFYALVSRLVQPYPRARALVEAFAALLPDVLRAGLQVVAAFTGRPAPRLDVVPIDPRLRRAEHVLGAIGTAHDEAVMDARAFRDRALAAEARVAELTAGEEPGRLRPTVVHGDDPPRSPDEASHAARTGRHRIPPGTMGALCLALACAGCGATEGASAALATATTAIKVATVVRRHLCARELDLLLGDPRAESPSSGGAAPSQSSSAPPAPPSAPPPTPAPSTPSQSSSAAASDAGAPAGMDGG